MLERASVKALPLANRAGEHAPMIGVCCNACRMCATSSAIGIIVAAAGAIGAFAARLVRRSA
jgi:hypothetical protein